MIRDTLHDGAMPVITPDYAATLSPDIFAIAHLRRRR